MRPGRRGAGAGALLGSSCRRQRPHTVDTSVPLPLRNKAQDGCWAHAAPPRPSAAQGRLATGPGGRGRRPPEPGQGLGPGRGPRRQWHRAAGVGWFSGDELGGRRTPSWLIVDKAGRRREGRAGPQGEGAPAVLQAAQGAALGRSGSPVVGAGGPCSGSDTGPGGLQPTPMGAQRQLWERPFPTRRSLDCGHRTGHPAPALKIPSHRW